MFASDEFCLTPAYDAGNPEHRRLKRLMEYGASLPDIPPFEGVTDALRQVEFELLKARHERRREKADRDRAVQACGRSQTRRYAEAQRQRQCHHH